MRYFAAIAAALLSAQCALAQDFEARLAKAREDSKKHVTSEQAQRQVIQFQAVVRACRRKGLAWSESFQVVAEVTKPGRLANVESDSSSDFAQCVVRELQDVFLLPPAEPHELAIRFQL